MTRFRPCIDLHSGSVKQIVGSTLTSPRAGAGGAPPSQSDSTQSDSFPISSGENPSGGVNLITNHTSPHPPSHFAHLYRTHNLRGAHVIMLGPGNEAVAREALAAWPGGMQVGGGLGAKDVGKWIEWGAEKVILTSYLFPNASFSLSRLQEVLRALGGDKEKLVIDLSCRRKGSTWVVAMDKWQRETDMEVNRESIAMLEPHCSEFLIHAAELEGLCGGIDESLIRNLGEWCSIPVTYAGGGRRLEDLDRVRKLSGGKVDLTIGSALDIFGGKGVRFEDCVEWNLREEGRERELERGSG